MTRHQFRFCSPLIALSLLALFVPVQATAQEPTDVPEYITGTRADVFFPHGVLLQLDIVLPAETDLVAAVLTLSSPSLGEQNISMDLEDEEIVTTNNRLIEINYLHQFTQEQSPDVFDEIEYRWDISVSDGGFESVQDAFSFADHRADWFSIEGETIPLLIHVPVNAASPDSIFRELDPVYTLLEANTGTQPDREAVVLYTEGLYPGCDYNEDEMPVVVNSAVLGREIPCEPGRADQLYEQSDMTLLDFNGNSAFAARRALVPVMVGQMYGPLWRGNTVPLWFRSGMAYIYSDVSDKINLLSPALVAARNGQLLSFGELATAPPLVSPEYAIWEAQSYGLVAYIAGEFGLESLFELARDANDYDSFADAYADIIGSSLQSLPSQWEVWVFSDEAPNIYGLNIYGPPTATPTREVTATPRPPSATPTVTATPTATGTATDTPLPPTETPTVTPRSARDVFTPTPVPVATPEATSRPPSSLRWVFLGIIGLAVLVIAVALMTGQRR